MLLVYAFACHSGAAPHAVFKSGPNAILHGVVTGTVRVWGPAGTVERVATPGPDGTTLLGEAGPLWLVETELPAVKKAPPVEASFVESVGYRLAPVLHAKPTGALDAAKSAGVYVRSLVKVRQAGGPPLYVVSATRDEIGAGKMDGPDDVRGGANCEAVVAMVDAKAERVLSSMPLAGAQETCAVPVLVSPVDRDGDGVLDILVHGQLTTGGFAAWFALGPKGTLIAGPAESWVGIP